MAEMILVEGLAGINQALSRSEKLIAGEGLRVRLREAAEPVKRDAEELSRSEISGMRRAASDPPPWSVQRVGQTVHEVYIVPRERGVKSRTDRSLRRPNLATLMLGRAYEPAVARNEPAVRAFVDVWLDGIVRSV